MRACPERSRRDGFAAEAAPTQLLNLPTHISQYQECPWEKANSLVTTRSKISPSPLYKTIPSAKDIHQKIRKHFIKKACCYLMNIHELKQVLSIEHIRKYPIPFAKRAARIGIIPPELVVVDSRIQDMCSLPFWTYYGSGEGSFSRCGGVGTFSCCPPFSLKAEKVQALIDRADIFVVLQTRAAVNVGNDPGAQFRMINRLVDEVNACLGRKAVIQKFAGGPCFACYPESCLCEGQCRAPELKVPSLEGMGICVDQLCKDMALLTGDEKWKVNWIKGFGADTQTPKVWKATVGLAIQLHEKS